MGNDKADLQLEHGLLGVGADVGNGGTGHQVEEGEDEGGAFPQDVVGFAGVCTERSVRLALSATHRLHHLPAQLERRRPRLRVPPCKHIPSLRTRHKRLG